MSQWVEQFARDLAEAKYHDPIGFGRAPEDKPDPRFAALRGEHETFNEESWSVVPVSQRPTNVCIWCVYGDAHSYCLRIDLDAWMDVAAACGFIVTLELSVNMEHFDCTLETDNRFYQSPFQFSAKGPTARDALANAIERWWES